MVIRVSGSLAFDIILDYPGRFADQVDPSKIHTINLSFRVDEVKKTVGGTAANIAYNLRLLDMNTAIIGVVGEDGTEFVSKLKQMGVDVSLLKVSKKLGTASAYIMTDRDDNQISAFFAGAMNEKCGLPQLGSCDWTIISPGNPDNMTRLARHYQKLKMRYIFDPGQAIFVLKKRQLAACIKGASILIGNDYEISLVQKMLGKKGFSLVTYKTLGPRGSEIIFPNGKKKKIGVVKAKKVVDPTGAGDAYRAGMIKGIASGYDLVQAGQLGATAATFAVEKQGTQNHKFNYGIIVKRHNRNFNNKIPISNL